MASCSSRCKVIGSIGFLNREAMKAFNLSDYATAEFLLFQARQMVQGANAPVVLEAKTRNNLGLVLQAKGDVQGADRNYRRALVLIRRRIGKDNRLYRVVERNYRRSQQAQLDTLLTGLGIQVA